MKPIPLSKYLLSLLYCNIFAVFHHRHILLMLKLPLHQTAILFLSDVTKLLPFPDSFLMILTHTDMCGI